MTLRFITVEDLGVRAESMQALCKAAGDTLAGEPVAALSNIDRLLTPNDIRLIDADELALVDAVFVDFDLNAHKVPGHHAWQPLIMTDGTQVRPWTGMSALLYLRDLMSTLQYRHARKTYLSQRDQAHRDWVGGDGSTRLFSFVEARDDTSRLFAAAAQAWFGAMYQNAQPDVADKEERDRAVAQLLMSPTARLQKDWPARLVANDWAGRLDDLLLISTFLGRNWGVIPSRMWPSNFDLFRVYLAHRGKAGFGKYTDPVGYRDAFHAVTGSALPKIKSDGESTPRFFGDMQGALAAFCEVTGQIDGEWPEWAAKGVDPMYDYLVDTRLFWESEDVRVAFEVHRGTVL